MRWLKTVVVAISVVASMALAVAPASAADTTENGTDVVYQNCSNIGNGLLCLKVDVNTYRIANITAWFDKRSGGPVTVRLGFDSTPANGPDGIDAGWFTAYAGNIYPYTWTGLYSPPGCYYPRLFLGGTSYINGACTNA